MAGQRIGDYLQSTNRSKGLGSSHRKCRTSSLGVTLLSKNFLTQGENPCKNIWRYDSGEAKGGGEIENIVTSQNGLLGAGLLKWQC